MAKKKTKKKTTKKLVKKPVRQFVRFTEINDNEGETWNFYIPVKGNEKSIKILQEFFGGDDQWTTMFCRDENIPENEVDILVKHTASGYMDFENKLDGIMNLERLLDMTKSDMEDAFYKGGIKDEIFWKGK